MSPNTQTSRPLSVKCHFSVLGPSPSSGTSGWTSQTQFLEGPAETLRIRRDHHPALGNLAFIPLRASWFRRAHYHRPNHYLLIPLYLHVTHPRLETLRMHFQIDCPDRFDPQAPRHERPSNFVRPTSYLEKNAAYPDGNRWRDGSVAGFVDVPLRKAAKMVEGADHVDTVNAVAGRIEVEGDGRFRNVGGIVEATTCITLRTRAQHCFFKNVPWKFLRCLSLSGPNRMVYGSFEPSW